MSNLKQIGLTMAMYASDYDDTLPRARFGNVGGEMTNWERMLNQTGYHTNWNVGQCPDVPERRASACGTSSWSSLPFSMLSGYAMNHLGCGAKASSSLQQPSGTILVLESRYCTTVEAFSQRTRFAAPHDGMGNSAFADGHVADMREPQAEADNSTTHTLWEGI